MIDMELLKPGSEVWIVHNNRPQLLKMERLDKLISNSGIQYNVVDGAFSVPADWCYSSKMELLEAQINYWRDMRLAHIVMDNSCS